MTPELKLLIVLILVNLPIYLLLGKRFIKQENSKKPAIFRYLELLFLEPSGYRASMFVIAYVAVFIIQYVLLLKFI